MTNIKRKIHVIGINSFEFRELPFDLQNLFIQTANIAVPESYLSNIDSWVKDDKKQKKLFFSSKSNSKLIDWLKSQKTDTIVISRGDPLWFGIGRILLENFSKEELSFYPAKTCLQLAFSKLKISWQETTFISIHGRDSTKLIKALNSKPSSLAIITDCKSNSLETIQKNLFELNLQNFYEFWICEEIGFQNERIRKFEIQDKLPPDISDINIVVLLKKENFKEAAEIPLFGINDNSFKTFEDRPKLLTKREIRIQILADLELPERGLMLDIGAGCGSIGLEALKLRPNLDLFCIDKRFGSEELIKENSGRLGVYPKAIFEDDINNLLNSSQIKSLQKAKRIVVGGCNKITKLRIISDLLRDICAGCVVVFPLIDIQSINDLREALLINNFSVNLNLVQTYKTLSISEGIRLEPNNPVFLLKGKKSI